jgi:hypothetical protein
MFGIIESRHEPACLCMGCCATRNALLAQQAQARGDAAELQFRGRLAAEQLMRARDEREGRS